jgi:RNA polymerase sigma factor (sigma-70 family)
VDDLSLIEKARLGCLTSKGTLVGKYRLIAVKAAGRYNCKGRLIETGDLIQEGMLGLLRAIELFDAGKGCRFSHYVRCKVRGAIRDAWNRQMRIEDETEGGVDTEQEQRAVDKEFWKTTLASCLDARERSVIRMHIWDEVDFWDISEKLCLPYEHVERIYARSLEKLKVYLIDNGLSEELGALV